ncbi:NAD(P)-binding protein [Microthyrium microscopicum]|uniref:NAD(P)-binding protein n=1 Tax=Microthyrium microscopicum TaxID=703497 RepID=A0A6A6UED3_9PEZI|nr:NAD(P)-binding protein [Microthyrium microscopicum]
MSKNSAKVFITGGSGFVASTIIDDLIKEGYKVTASVRSPQRAKEIIDTHPSWESSLDFAYVADIVEPGAFDEAFKNEKDGFDYVMHTASPVTFVVDDIQKFLIDPAVQGTLGVMKSAHELGGSKLKRFVLLSSGVAALDSFEDTSKAGKDYTEANWNPVTAEYAIENNDTVSGYNASKKLAEEAAWKFMEENKPAFDLTVLNPQIIIGPMLQPVSKPESFNETNIFAVYNFLNGAYKKVEDLKFPFYHFIDVRDVSRAHVLALTNPAASNKRIIIVSGLITPQLIVNIIGKNFPQLKSRLPEGGDPNKILPEGTVPTGWDTSRSFQIFGESWKYKELEESLVDTVNAILEFEKKWDV